MAKQTEKSSKIKFSTVLLTAGKTATGIRVPEEVVEKLASGKRPPVCVTINNYTYRSTIAVMGGAFMIGVSAEVRDKAGVAGGDKIDVVLELDTKPREVVLPAAFSKILNSHKEAKQYFEGLSYSNKLRLVLPIEQAKTESTRQRNIEKAMTILKAGK